MLHHVGGAGLVGHAVDDPLVERLLVGSPEAHAVPVRAQGVVLTALGTIHGQSAAHLGIVADGVVHRHRTLGLGLDSTGIALRRDAHGDGLADVLAGQFVGRLIGALDGLAVPQPLVAQVSVGHAAGLGSQGLAALQLAVDGHRAGDIRQSALVAAGIADGIIRIGVVVLGLVLGIAAAVHRAGVPVIRVVAVPILGPDVGLHLVLGIVGDVAGHGLGHILHRTVGRGAPAQEHVAVVLVRLLVRAGHLNGGAVVHSAIGAAAGQAAALGVPGHRVLVDGTAEDGGNGGVIRHGVGAVRRAPLLEGVGVLGGVGAGHRGHRHALDGNGAAADGQIRPLRHAADRLHGRHHAVLGLVDLEGHGEVVHGAVMAAGQAPRALQTVIDVGLLGGHVPLIAAVPALLDVIIVVVVLPLEVVLQLLAHLEDGLAGSALTGDAAGTGLVIERRRQAGSVGLAVLLALRLLVEGMLVDRHRHIQSRTGPVGVSLLEAHLIDAAVQTGQSPVGAGDVVHTIGAVLHGGGHAGDGTVGAADGGGRGTLQTGRCILRRLLNDQRIGGGGLRIVLVAVVRHRGDDHGTGLADGDLAGGGIHRRHGVIAAAIDHGALGAADSLGIAGAGGIVGQIHPRLREGQLLAHGYDRQIVQRQLRRGEVAAAGDAQLHRVGTGIGGLFHRDAVGIRVDHGQRDILRGIAVAQLRGHFLGVSVIDQILAPGIGHSEVADRRGLLADAPHDGLILGGAVVPLIVGGVRQLGHGGVLTGVDRLELALQRAALTGGHAGMGLAVVDEAGDGHGGLHLHGLDLPLDGLVGLGAVGPHIPLVQAQGNGILAHVRGLVLTGHGVVGVRALGHGEHRLLLAAVGQGGLGGHHGHQVCGHRLHQQDGVVGLVPREDAAVVGGDPGQHLRRQGLVGHAAEVVLTLAALDLHHLDVRVLGQAADGDLCRSAVFRINEQIQVFIRAIGQGVAGNADAAAQRKLCAAMVGRSVHAAALLAGGVAGDAAVEELGPSVRVLASLTVAVQTAAESGCAVVGNGVAAQAVHGELAEVGHTAASGAALTADIFKIRIRIIVATLHQIARIGGLIVLDRCISVQAEAAAAAGLHGHTRAIAGGKAGDGTVIQVDVRPAYLQAALGGQGAVAPQAAGRRRAVGQVGRGAVADAQQGAAGVALVAGDGMAVEAEVQRHALVVGLPRLRQRHVLAQIPVAGAGQPVGGSDITAAGCERRGAVVLLGLVVRPLLEVDLAAALAGVARHGDVMAGAVQIADAVLMIDGQLDDERAVPGGQLHLAVLVVVQREAGQIAAQITGVVVAAATASVRLDNILAVGRLQHGHADGAAGTPQRRTIVVAPLSAQHDRLGGGQVVGRTAHGIAGHGDLVAASGGIQQETGVAVAADAALGIVVNTAALRTGGVAGNAAADQLHAAAAVADTAAVGGRGVAGDAAAVHLELAVLLDRHTAAEAAGVVAGDGAAVHVEGDRTVSGSVHEHTVAEALDGTGVQVERAVGLHLYACAAARRRAAAVDDAAALAVHDVQGVASGHVIGIVRAVLHGDGVAVQAQRHVLIQNGAAADGHVVHQSPRARRGGQAVGGGPFLIDSLGLIVAVGVLCAVRLVDVARGHQIPAVLHRVEVVAGLGNAVGGQAADIDLCAVAEASDDADVGAVVGERDAAGAIVVPDLRVLAQLQCAAVVHIDGTALTAGDHAVAHDVAAGHGERTAGAHIHAAAVPDAHAAAHAARAAVIADAAAVHVEGAVVQNAAAVLHNDADAALVAVAVDMARVHVERAVVVHTAAVRADTADDGAHIQVERAVIADAVAPIRLGVGRHQCAGVVVLAPFAAAVGQAERHAGVHRDDIKAAARDDAVAVGTQHGALLGLPRLAEGHVPGQVIAARLGGQGILGLPGREGLEVGRGMAAADRVLRAADAVVVGRQLLQLLVLHIQHAQIGIVQREAAQRLVRHPALHDAVRPAVQGDLCRALEAADVNGIALGIQHAHVAARLGAGCAVLIVIVDLGGAADVQNTAAGGDAAIGRTDVIEDGTAGHVEGTVVQNAARIALVVADLAAGHVERAALIDHDGGLLVAGALVILDGSAVAQIQRSPIAHRDSGLRAVDAGEGHVAERQVVAPLQKDGAVFGTGGMIHAEAAPLGGVLRAVHQRQGLLVRDVVVGRLVLAQDARAVDGVAVQADRQAVRAAPPCIGRPVLRQIHILGQAVYAELAIVHIGQ